MQLKAVFRREGGLEPKSLCTENGPNRFFIRQISLCPTMKSGSGGAGGQRGGGCAIKAE